METRDLVHNYIVENFLFGDNTVLAGDEMSLLDNGIIDSVGVMELVAFLESDFGLSINDDELTPDNLDSITNLTSFIGLKQAV